VAFWARRTGVALSCLMSCCKVRKGPVKMAKIGLACPLQSFIVDEASGVFWEIQLAFLELLAELPVPRKESEIGEKAREPRRAQGAGRRPIRPRAHNNMTGGNPHCWGMLELKREVYVNIRGLCAPPVALQISSTMQGSSSRESLRNASYIATHQRAAFFPLARSM
jgi:hypothetical protein